MSRPQKKRSRAKRWYTLKKPFRVQILDRMATPVRVVYNAYFETAETDGMAHFGAAGMVENEMVNSKRPKMDKMAHGRFGRFSPLIAPMQSGPDLW